MRKYIASKRQRVLHFICLLFPFALTGITVFGIYYVVRENQDGFLFFLCVCVLLILSITGLVTYIWKFFSDPILGEFTFDETGVTFYTPVRTITFSYDECAEIRFTCWPGGGIINTRYIYYIYFSKKTLTAQQRAYLFDGRSTKKRGKLNKPLYLTEYVLFQYRPDIFAEFIECVPGQFRKILIQAEKELDH